jgi:hypothetical protein
MISSKKESYLNSSLKEQAEKELGDVLDEVQGDKVLVLDSDVVGPLGLVAPSAIFQQHGVRKVYLLGKIFTTQLENIVYICHPKIDAVTRIVEQLNSFISKKESEEDSLMDIMGKKDNESKPRMLIWH